MNRKRKRKRRMASYFVRREKWEVLDGGLRLYKLPTWDELFELFTME